METKLQIWTKRVGGSVYRITNEQRDAIAKLCLEAELRGDTVNNVWHHTSQYFGTADRCPCAHCTSVRIAG
jgi:hypothetical protein